MVQSKQNGKKTQYLQCLNADMKGKLFVFS